MPTYGPGTCEVSGTASGPVGFSYSISGALKTKFEWVRDYPNEPVPLSAVVMESCNVSMGATSFGGVPFASANNGLDTRFCTNTATTGGSGLNKYANASSSGTAAKVVAGAEEIEVTCSPTASITGNRQQFVFLSYSASVHPKWDDFVTNTTGLQAP